MDVTLHLNRGRADVPWARHELLALLESSEVAADPDCVGLVVTELLTNALLHGEPPVEVHARTQGEHLRVEVRDSSPVSPEPRAADLSDLTGRGLMLVAGLVERWGVDQSGDGKVVWAEFDGHPQRVEVTSTAVSSPSPPTSTFTAPPSLTTSSSSGQRSSTDHGAGNTPPVSAMPAGQLRSTSQ